MPGQNLASRLADALQLGAQARQPLAHDDLPRATDLDVERRDERIVELGLYEQRDAVSLELAAPLDGCRLHVRGKVIHQRSQAVNLVDTRNRDRRCCCRIGRRVCRPVAKNLPAALTSVTGRLGRWAATAVCIKVDRALAPVGIALRSGALACALHFVLIVNDASNGQQDRVSRKDAVAGKSVLPVAGRYLPLEVQSMRSIP